MSASGHSFEDHVSEVRLRATAPTLRELFEEMARGLAELTAEVSAEARRAPEEHVELVARDRDALLVAWLNELVFRSETRKLVYDDVRVDAIEGASLVATVRGREPRVARTAVKAATMHGLAIEEVGGGFAAAVVLDV